MKNRLVLLLAVVAVVAAGYASRGVIAQDTRPPRIRVSGIFDGQLVARGEKIYASVPPDSAGVEFIFQPATSGDVRVRQSFSGRTAVTWSRRSDPTAAVRCARSECFPWRSIASWRTSTRDGVS